MATVMASMPDVWRRTLAEHVPDQHQRCRACWSPAGEQASWPCQTFRVADEARVLAEGGLPVPSRPTVSGPLPTFSSSPPADAARRGRGL